MNLTLFPANHDLRPGHLLLHRVLRQVLLLGGLASLSVYNYLLFHSLAELYSIVIASGIFMLAWNARHHYHNNYLLFIGTAYLFVTGFDTLHMLGYHGMSVFTSVPGYNLGPQLWLVGRAMEALTLVVAPWFIQHPLPRGRIFALYLVASVVAVWAIFRARIFPVCFTPETGLTSFKIVAEYIIIAVLFLALVLLIRCRSHFDRQVYALLLGSVVLTIASELCFTLYVSHYGISNLLGHLFKILSFTLIYFAIIDTAINRPVALLFRDLKQRQDALLAAQHAARLGSWSWRAGAATMIWTQEVFRQLGLDHATTRPTLAAMLDAVHSADRERLQEVFNQALEQQRPFEIELQRLAAGETRYLRFEGACTQDEDGATLLAGIVQDVTERIMAEKLRDDIDSITRHDLRAPLTPIIGLSEFLLRYTSLAEQQSDMVRDIHACGLKMQGMINSSLSLYKLERGTYRLQPDYFDLAHELTELLRELAASGKGEPACCQLLRHGEPISAAEPFLVYGEKFLCYSLFANLLTNAVEASPAGARVTVDMRQNETAWLIAVHNDGVVPPQVREHFFEKYVTYGKQQGTGLGTYSAMLTARAHGGTIHLETSAAAGTTLTVELPKPEWMRDVDPHPTV